jgi:hypothetical protein
MASVHRRRAPSRGLGSILVDQSIVRRNPIPQIRMRTEKTLSKGETSPFFRLSPPSARPHPNLYQDRTAINHNGLARTESFVHQEQIGLRHFRSFTHAANGETIAHAFV